MAGTSVPRAPPGVMLGGDMCSRHHTTGARTAPHPPPTAQAVPSSTWFRWGSARRGPL